MGSEHLETSIRKLAQECDNNDCELKKVCEHILDGFARSSVDTREAILLLSEHILNLSYAKLFNKYLSNVLLILVTNTIPLKRVFSNTNYDSCNDSEKIKHVEYSIALALLSDHPDVLQYALKYFEINSVALFEVFIHHEDSYNVAPKKRRLAECRQKISDAQMVEGCYTLLRKLPNELSAKWDWTSFVTNFSAHESMEIRWMVKECMAILTNMTESQSKILSSNMNISEIDNVLCIERFRTQDIVVSDKEMGDLTNFSTDSIINIDGIMLPVYDKSNVREGRLVPVKSTISNLRSLALAVASGNAISLQGPVGSGKTSFVEHLAAITGRKGVAFKKIQLGDQTDSRMLLGAHQCTDVPGEFIWRPGVLTEAVQNGHWLLLEDIDSAALDVASTLSSLIERNALCVPGYRDSLAVTPGFQLFVTQRTIVTNYGFQKRMSNSSTLLQKHLTQINVEPLSRSELSEIIQNIYPSLTTISPRMIEVFMMFSVGSHDTSLQATETVDKETSLNVMRGSRLISTRDLMKWCARAVVGFEVCSPESALKVLQDALDIFTCSVASPEDRLQLAKKIGTCLGIVETKTEFYCKHHKPNVSLNPSALEVGRARVLRKEKDLNSVDFDNKQVVFSFTRQSACLLERIACCVTSSEPVLLVGETGTGKTSSVQYLARQTGHKLIVINMNQQSDSADLLGGYKPVDLKYVIKPIRTEFEEMFKSFYNVEKNQKFLSHIETCYETENWMALMTLMKQSYKAAINRMTNEKKKELKLKKWLSFGHKLAKLEQQIRAESRLTFAFIEGSLVKAMQEGHWVLLDEINLASAEILECLAGLLEDKDETIDLLEKGDKVPIKRHPDFTLFACMNPATDVGKKDLPVGLRNRFTEFFVDELTERNDLMLLIGDYLYHMNLSGSVLEAIYNFYATIRKEAKLSLVDGAGNAPHFSLRTLCRALTAAAKARCGTVTRSLYEAFCLSFLTQLDSSSHPKVEAMIAKAVIGKKNIKSVLNQIIPEPHVKGQNFLLFEGHWIPQGKLDIAIPEGYILTPTVRKNLRDISRIISLGRLPVLLQGDTSVGKTSLITYIAKASGNYCVRINNHEHTDLQEYIGSYATDASGKLVFKEGVLVEAMRKGYWIILDELNLAPSDVLEALNRVLDDNRELFIPETQQVVKADPNFMLFATQNPPGLYGGRKMLSRAFRNRFVELHFDEIPRKELEIILHQRCHVPPAYSKKMIAVMAELQVRRRGSAAVQGKDGFITLRDLFRWGERYKGASKETLTDDKFYDWDQHIADEGYLILAGKVRQTDERHVIEEVIEKHIKRKVYPDNLFSLHQMTSPVTRTILETILNNQLEGFTHVVWTYNMRRLAVLIAKAFTFDEPVLLVGDTGCGKTTICQVLAALKGRQLLSVNCHMHTESSDFIGGLRPVRQYKNDGRLFEWADGPLIKTMESGNMFLADEISLADDSVLERLNSLLEPERQLVLAERGLGYNSDIVVITADKAFNFIGTMNPGGDFGKKELSPALRNRFTEIWCSSVTSRSDLLKVLEKSVNKGISLGNQEDGSSGIGNSILDFTDWLKNSEVTNKFPFSIRDLLSWVQFINVTVSKNLLDTPEAYVHGACMTFLDCFGTALTGHIEPETLFLVRKTAINFLLDQIKTVGQEYIENLKKMLSEKQTKFSADLDDKKFGIKPFYIEVGKNNSMAEEEQKFTFTAPTTGSNTLRLLRGLQLNKAILLEGNPGVGKTSLVTALAKSSGHKVIRINLSDQTDITDLFGTDLPTEDGSFTFKEGAFLNALQNGDWILLDELNLAPQPVLEGLNACLDHRGEVFIPELGRTFKVKEQTRLFACQNPLKQGGARRGLPLSFLNRFTQVYIDTLTSDDLMYIVNSQYPALPDDILSKIVSFNCKVAHEVTDLQSWGHRGAPWEMNLRDIQRWCEALSEDQKNGKKLCPGKFVDMLYVNRMRTIEDKIKMTQIYDALFCPNYPRSSETPQFLINEKDIAIGDVTIERNVEKTFKNRRAVTSNLLVLRNELPTLKSLAQNVKMNWLTILVGPTATGKSSIVQLLADLSGNELQVIPVTSAMDVSDLLGGFEQVDYNRNCENLFDKIETLTIQCVRNKWLSESRSTWDRNKLLSNLYQYKNLITEIESKDTNNDTEHFKRKIQFLLKHCEMLVGSNKAYGKIWNQLKEVQFELEKLQGKVNKLSSVNAGGKFEWVDSLLVKTLIEGSWLCLDNVNLTSAAVLDRLNGLLEPNGVLSIPERGEISEIKPHPNFRVFFTMDPKYGEISRAMRNRGVEIFLLRPDDFNVPLTETIHYMDLTALLNSCGLPNYLHKACIACHELMSSFIQGFERPTVSHLLQASNLTWQQMMRGISYKAAILNSFSNVYIKPRCGGDFTNDVKNSLAEMKNLMFKDLTKYLAKEFVALNTKYPSDHTMTVQGLSTNSTYEALQQILYPLREVSLEVFRDWIYGAYALTSILVLYQKCPSEYLVVLKQLEWNLSDHKLDQSFYNLNQIARSSLGPINSNAEAQKRFYPENYEINDQVVYQSNAKTLLMFYNILKKFLEAKNEKITKFNLSAFTYSKAIASKTLGEDLVEYPIIKNCARYIETVDKYLENFIDSGKDWDDKRTCHVILMLLWRQRFVKQSQRSLYDTEKERITHLVEKIAVSLKVHSKWLHKYLMEELFEIVQNDKLAIKFKKEIAKIIVPETKANHHRAKFGKRLRIYNGQPRPSQDEFEYSRLTAHDAARSDVYKKVSVDIHQPLNPQTNKFSVDLSTVTDWTLAVDEPRDENIKKIQENLTKALEYSHNVIKASEMNLLPLYAYIFQRILVSLDASFACVSVTSVILTESVTNEINRCKFPDILNGLIHLGERFRGMPPSLMDFLKMLLKLDAKDIGSWSIISTKMWDEVYKALVFSPALHPLPFLTFKRCLVADEVSVIPAHTKRLSTNLPLMAYYVQKLTVSDEIEGSRHLLAYETVPLSERAEYSMQLGTILNILWKNIGVLDLTATSKVLITARNEMDKYEKLLDDLTARHDPKEMPDMNEIFYVYEDPVKYLRTYLHEDSETLEIIQKASDAYEKLSPVKNWDYPLDNEKTINRDDMKIKVLSAELSVYTSLAFMKIICEINPMDYVEKYRLRRQYLDEDIELLDALLTSYYLQGLVSGTISTNKEVEICSQVALYRQEKDNLHKVHPYCEVLLKMRSDVIESAEKYHVHFSYRPETPSYASFYKECQHFTNSVLWPQTLKKIYSTLISTCKELHQNVHALNRSAIQNAQTVLKEAESWLYSVTAFYKKIESVYSNAFPDLAKPLLMSLSRTVYCVSNMRDLIQELIVKTEQGPFLKDVVTYLMEYPNGLHQNKEEHLNRFVCSKFVQILNRNVMAASGDSINAEVEGLEVLKMNLTELRMYSTAKEGVDAATTNAVLNTLSAIVKTWEKQQRDIEKHKQDEEALYVTKSKCEDEDDDTIAQNEIQEMFPSYSELDFGEFKPANLEQKPVKIAQNSNKIKQLISSDDVTLVYKWHSNYMKNLTAAEWLPSPKKLVGNDVVTPYVQRYPIFSRIMQNAWEALNADIEGELSPGLMVLISQIKEKVDGVETSTKPDFYKSASVSETRQCLPLLLKVKESTNELLDQWPDFPTLKDIMAIVNRILSFPVSSPISRFLTGLELLRDKLEEWNKSAHKGNNLIEVSLAVGAQIINWRKLEMGHWRECLSNLYQRKQSEGHKYWFYLYSVVTSYLSTPDNVDPVPAERVVSVLKDFMETSNLAEFQVRLDIVYVYHCHLVHLEDSVRRDELLSIFWNTHNYYSQFSAQVASYIKEKRAPIEKKLRDFVKICTWDRDLSYWSVKDTVEKAHKALHKHTKEFETVLKESVANCLVDNMRDGTEHVGIWDRPKRATGSNAIAGGAYLIDTQNHLALARNLKKYLDQAEQPSSVIPEGSLLTKVPSLFNKAKTLCKDAMTNAGYPALVQALDDFVTMVIENSTHLGSLEVDTTLPKDKQTSQAKNIVQQKRKALADLFKYLTRMGLNYRTGLVLLSANENLYDFTIPPVDLDAAVSYLKSRRCDASLSLLWSGCEKYLQKSIARHRLLAAGLLTPHQDLGMMNIERCKGFAAQLMKLANSQKKSISKYSRLLCDLRTLTTNLTDALAVDQDAKNSSITIANLNQRIEALLECYANICILLDQFSIVLKSCPDKELADDPDFDSIISNSVIVKCYKNSEEWNELYSKVKTMISLVNKNKTALHKLNMIPKTLGRKLDALVVTQNHLDVSKEAENSLRILKSDAEAIIKEYEFTIDTILLDEYASQHPLLRSMTKLTIYIDNVLQSFESIDESMTHTDGNTEMTAQAEDLVATMLLVIQSVYKKHLPEDKSTDNSEVLNAIDEIIQDGKEKEESKEILEDNHLKELLQEKLSSDCQLLQLKTLTDKLKGILLQYVHYIATRNDGSGEVKNVVMRLVPILEQIVLFVQFFVTQKVAVHRVSCKMLSVLLKIFSDLAAKGFCKPSDLDMEEGDGEGGPGKLSAGTGLGEGEGQKDVSDRIENQDQLDDAHKPGEEKKGEERDCKEEEKGIDMSDDFDSHLQDVETKEGDDEKEDEEDDADKQMGDIDNAAEKLDQQIWGSEDEEDIENEKQKQKEEKGKGESTGEKEMAAKEEQQEQDDGGEGKERKKKKDINEMEEPEVDDDHVDPYHGNQQPMPEPEDFDLPENMDVDGEEKDDNEGETETENPFEIDVPKDLPEDQEEKPQKEDNEAGLEVSSDEEGDDDKDGNDKAEQDGDDKDKGEDEHLDDKADSKEEDANTDEQEENTGNNEDQEMDPQQETQDENPEKPQEDEDLPKNPDEIKEDDAVEEKKQDANPQANPSTNDPSAGERAEHAEMDKGTDDNVDINAQQEKDEDAAPFEQAQEQVGEDKQSTGRSELDKSETGHRGEKQAARAEQARDRRQKRENKPGRTDHERTLGDVNEEKHKQSKTLNVENKDQEEDGADHGDDNEKDADAYQHVKQAKKDDLQAVDAATKEQAEQQPTLQQEDEEADAMKDDDEVPMDVDDDDLQVEKSEELKPEKVKEGALDKENDKSGKKKDSGDDPTGETGIEVEGDTVTTAHVPRGRETTYHTRLADPTHQPLEDLPFDQYLSIRSWLNSGPTPNTGTTHVWRSLWRDSGAAARALCERLRLVLEPTQRSRRAGDYRSGRAINMRRVISYIASHFRKDRIWLRRTKPAKREYKIAIAVDDSSSMSDNRSKELAFESLALVSQALNLLESGDLAVLSFGERPNLLHPFTEQFSEHSGSKILEQLRFDQTKTKIAQFLDFCTVMFEDQAVRSEALNAKLLVIVSDGRGIFSEGETKVIQAVRRAKQAGIFVVYVVIDNPDNKDSIMDIRRPLVDPTSNAVQFVSYLDTFPFPFYLILRDMSALPNVLGDALRQWFELAANTTS